MATDSTSKILVVDDLEENLLALTALLRSDRLSILTARSGVEALELLLVHDVALALLDDSAAHARVGPGRAESAGSAFRWNER